VLRHPRHGKDAARLTPDSHALPLIFSFTNLPAFWLIRFSKPTQALDVNGDVNVSSQTARVSIGGTAMYKTAAGELVIST